MPQSDLSVKETADWTGANLKPLWESKVGHMPDPAPTPPTVWRWEALQKAAAVALESTTMDVERRVLLLVGPKYSISNEDTTVNNLTAAIQMLKPGEAARPHRHSANALRFVLQGSGVTTFVDGSACPMAERDLILTPGWTWHSHSHDGEDPIIWLDVLDVPLHVRLEAMRFEAGPPKTLPPRLPEAASDRSGIVPIYEDWEPDNVKLRYTYEHAIDVLRVMPRATDGSRTVAYMDPRTSRTPLQTMTIKMLQLDLAMSSTAYRSTASAICCAVEGSGSSGVGDVTVDWRRNDIFTLPHGNWITHHAISDNSRLLIVSDEAALAALGLLKIEFR